MRRYLYINEHWNYTEAFKIVAHFEGFRAEPYYDIVNVLTIGYGRTHGIKPGEKTTMEAEKMWMLSHFQEIQWQLEPLINVPLTLGQFSALLSFCYNVGVGAFKGSTMRKLLNEGKYEAGGQELLKWTRAGNQRNVPGLVRRRKAELELWKK